MQKIIGIVKTRFRTRSALELALLQCRFILPARTSAGIYALVGNTISEQLELIVALGRVTAVALFNQIFHEISRFSFALIKDESLPKMGNSVWFEARQPAIKHEHDNVAQLPRMLARRKERFNAEFFEPPVRLGSGAASHD